MRAAAKCIIDRSRPCGACVAPSPQECPYLYLLDPDELAAVVAAGRAAASSRAVPGRGTPVTAR